MGDSVLMQGMECSTIEVPLHSVLLQSNLKSGPVIVGVRPSLPVEGVDFVLGNDLGGGKVKPDPIVPQMKQGLGRTNEMAHGNLMKSQARPQRRRRKL